MRQFTVPTSTDHFDYLLRLYFGADRDCLTSCISRAYRDLNRTLHGFAQVREGKDLRAQGSAVVRSFLSDIPVTPAAAVNQTGFDERHRAACFQLCSTYSAVGFPDFRIGQAQKWLNMALKYVFVFGEERLPGYAAAFGFAHIPIDNIILGQLRPLGLPRLSTAWSRLASYDEYMEIQRWFRSTFSGSAPLAVEFALWQNPGSATPQV